MIFQNKVLIRPPYIYLVLLLLLTGCLEGGGGGDSSFNFVDPGSANENLVVRITAYLPSNSSLSFTDATSQVFSVTASGGSGGASLTYSWLLDGAQVGTTSSANIIGTSLTVGSHTLKAIATDGSTTDSHTWTLKKNVPPVISAYSPNQATYKMNYQATQTFYVTATDANSDTLTYTWYINNATSGPFTGTGNSVVFTANSTYIGSNTIKVEVSDGTEVTTQSWTVEINYFSEKCNRLQIGEICTLVGDPTLGHGRNPTDDQNEIKIRPRYILDDGVGNLFVSDDVNHVIWFYNRSAANITIATTLVEPGKFRIILGSGGYGKGTTEPSPTDFKINSPEQLYWDSGNQILYVADLSNHRVIRLLSTGVTESVLGGGAGAGSTTVPANGNTLDCNSATGVVMVGTDLYVACYGRHVIRKVDTTTAGFPTLNVAGTYNTAGNVDGLATTVGRTQNPRHLQRDAEGNIYWSGYSDCTIKAYRPPSLAGSVTFFSGQPDQVIINAGEMKTIAGRMPTSCANTDGAPISTARFQNPIGFAMIPDRSGFFVSTLGGAYQVRYVNNTNSTVTYGGQAASAYQVSTVGNTAGSTGFNGDGQLGKNTRFNQIYSLSLNATQSQLYISDLINLRSRQLDLSITNGLVTTLLGAGRTRSGFVGDTEMPVMSAFLNQPTHVYYDSAHNKLLFSDTSNQRIRSVDMLKGTVATLLGRSGSAVPIENDIPSNVILSAPRGITMIGSNIFYADQGSSNCMIRAWNKGSVGATLFGIFMNPDTVWSLAGDYTQGCVNYPGTGSEGGTGTTAGLNNLEGLASDGTNLYFANYQNHCIHKLATDGTISTVVGSCGNTADVEGHPTTAARLRFPSQIFIDPSNASTGNMFIADRTDQTTAKIRYVNFDTTLSKNIAGVTIPPLYMKTLTTCSRCYGVAASTTEFCFGSGADSANGDNNVTCVDRTTGLTTLRVGPPNGGVSGGGPFDLEQEGVNATSARLDAPYAITFDAAGNLIIADRYNHLIRYVRRH